MERELLDNGKELTTEKEQNNFLQSAIRTSNKLRSRHWTSSSITKLFRRCSN